MKTHRPLVACCLLALVAVPALPATAQTAPAPPRVATMSVAGEGAITQAPDQAVVTVRIESTDDTAARATTQNNSTANGLVNRLTALGITGNAIKTSAYSIDYNPRPPKPDPSQAIRYGYTVSRTVSVTVDKVEQAGTVVDAAVAAGVPNVNGVAFQLRDRRAALRAAEAAAFADADAQARGLADAAHIRLGRIVHITPTVRFNQPQPLVRFAARDASAAAIPTQIDPGSLTVSATVSVDYELLP